MVLGKPLVVSRSFDKLRMRRLKPARLNIERPRLLLYPVPAPARSTPQGAAALDQADYVVVGYEQD